jgi:hypothetical protein
VALKLVKFKELKNSMILNSMSNSNIHSLHKRERPSRLRQSSTEKSYEFSLQKNSIENKEPLKLSVKTQPSFKGSYNLDKKNFKTFWKFVKENVFYESKEISLDSLKKSFNNLKGSFPSEVLEETISTALKNSKSTIIKTGDNFSERLTDSVIGPFKGLINFTKSIFNPAFADETKNLNIVKKFASFTEEAKNLKTPSDIKNFISSNWQGKGSTLSIAGVTITNRIVAGFISAGFLGVDFYNTTRIINDDHKKATKEAQKRMTQETIRLGITAYLTFSVNKILEKVSAKSMWFALGTNALVVLISETIGRKLNGNEVMPMSKQRYDKLKSQNKLDSNKESKEKQRLENPPLYTRKLLASEIKMQGKISNLNSLNMIKGASL